MNRLRRTGVFFLVLIVLFSTTGFTIWDHICGCRPSPEVAVSSCCVPEEATASCCEDEVPQPAEAGEDCGTGCGHDHNGCKEVPLYFKASIIAVPSVQKVVLPELVQALVTELPFLPGTDGEALNPRFAVIQDKPPPRAGKELVFYLHQLRIPLSA